MANIPTRISLQFDVSRPCLATYMTLSGLERRRLSDMLFDRLFGAKKAMVLELMTSATWKPTLESEVIEQSGQPVDTMRPTHAHVRTAMDVARTQLNSLLEGGNTFAFAESTEHEHEHDAGATQLMGVDVPHCTVWVLIDGRLVPRYNYALVLEEPNPDDPSKPRRSTEVMLTDYLGTQDQVRVGLHLALEYTAQ